MERHRKKGVQAARQEFTAGQASRLTGVPYRTLDFWAKFGFLRPSAREAEGTGTSRLYTFRDLLELKVAKRLRDAGISLQALRKVRARLHRERQFEAPFAETYLVTNGRDVFEVIRGRNEVWSLLVAPEQRSFPWLILDLVQTAKDVARDAEEERGMKRAS